MDDIIIRPRYPRHNTTSRRRRNSQRYGSSLNRLMYRQLAISIILLAAILLVKNINTPLTNYLSDRVKEAVTWNIDVKSLYNEVLGLLGRTDTSSGSISTDKEFEKKAVPAASGLGAASGESKTESTPSNNAAVLDDSSMEEIAAGLNKKFSFIQPVEGILSSSFGERVDPLTGTVKMHKGIDIEAEKGTPIKAVLGGEVAEAGTERSYGNYIKLMHEDGVVTIYAHCLSLSVKKGQKVKQGDVIAKVGNTGASVGSHLHLEIWKDGKALDPLKFIDVPSS
jgi:murein DD-endopeptidase MepM/ murein hydrolase activator NlpD